MRNRFLAINLALLLMLSSLFMQAPFAEAQEAAEITDAGTNISESLPVSNQEEKTPAEQEVTANADQEKSISEDPAETTTAGSIEAIPTEQEDGIPVEQQVITPAALEEAQPAAQETIPWAGLNYKQKIKFIKFAAPLPKPTELSKNKISLMSSQASDQYLTVNGTRFRQGVSKSGEGWDYDGTTNSLILDDYVGSSIITDGTASGGDLNIYCYGKVSVTGTAGSDGGDAVSVGGSLTLEVVTGTASFTGGPGKDGQGGCGIYGGYAYIQGDTDTKLNVTGGYGNKYGAPGILGYNIFLSPAVATITGGDSGSDPGCGIGVINYLYIDYCEMDVKAGNSFGQALKSYGDSATYSVSPYAEEKIIDYYWYNYTSATFTTILNGNDGDINGEGSLTFSEKYPFELDLEKYIFTKSGCQQIGWRTKSGEFITLTELYLPDSDDELTAEWVSVDDDTVLFNAFGGQIDGSYYKITKTGSAVAIPDRKSTTYITVDASGSDLFGYLIGWTDSIYPYYDNDDKLLCPESQWYTPGATAAIKNQSVLYAGWVNGTGNVISYHGNGGITAAGSDTAEQVNFADTADLSLNVLDGTTFTRKGYVFNGWKTSNGTSYYVGRSVAGDLYTIKTLDLYAQWVPVTLKSISASFTQGQTKVYSGSTLDSLKSMLVVTGVYSDSSTVPISTADYTLSGTLKAGISTITVNAGGKTTTFNVTVTAISAASIEVKTPPAKTAYVAFNAFEPAGMTVTIYYNDGSSNIIAVTSNMVSYASAGATSLRAGDTFVTINYGGKSVTTAVTVAKAKVQKPSVTGAYTYSGIEQTASIAASDKYSIAGNKGTAAAGYSATMTLTDSANYEWADGTNVPLILPWTIAPATITGYITSAPTAKVLANSSFNTDAVALKNGAIALPSKVAIAFGTGKTESIDIAWADAAETYNVKGAVYTYRGIVSTGSNFNAYSTALNATLTVAPIKLLSVTTVPAAVTVTKNTVISALSLTDSVIGFPLKVSLGFDNSVPAVQIDPTWNKTLGDLQMLAANVTEELDQETTVAFTDTNIPKWATVGITLPSTAITITNKLIISQSDITFQPIAAVYGGTVSPDAEVSEKTYGAYTVAYTYTGTGATVYGPSETAPQNAGIYTVRAIVENSIYKGTKSVSLTIAPKSVSANMINDVGAQIYSGSAITPALTITDGNAVLTLISDYTAVYTKNVNAGTATVVITGKGNYLGTASRTFVISPKNISGATIARIAEQTYIGNAITPLITVSNGALSLKTAVDFTTVYTNNINAGTATVTITGIGNYTGTESTAFTINPRSISDTVISNIIDYDYTGSEITQTPIVKDGTRILAAGSDYTLSYNSNRNAGKAAVIVMGIGNFTGTVSLDFQILNKMTLIVKNIDKSVLTTGQATELQNEGRYTVTLSARTANSNVYSVAVAETSALISYASSDAAQGSGQWVGILIGGLKVNGGDTVTTTGIYYSFAGINFNQVTADDVAEANTVVGTVDQNKYFIVWLKADSQFPRTIYLATDVSGANRITANCTMTPYSSHGGGGGGNLTVASGNTAATTEDWGSGTLTKMTANIAAKTDKTGTASANITAAQINDAISAVIKAAGSTSASPGGLVRTAVEIKVKPDNAAEIINVTIPQDAFKSLTKNSLSFLTISSPLANMTFDAEALKTIGDNAAADITVKIAVVDKNTLSETSKAQVGDRPVYDLAVTSSDKTISDFGSGTVTVSIPYTPAANEDSNSIVIYYISNQGELISIPNCIYDPATGTVSFKTSHFSTYAVGYNKTNFSDVSGWFADAVNLLAARGIVSGTGVGRFSPNESVTRAQFAMMLAKLSGDDLTGYTSSSFSDVDSSAWYSTAVQWAYAKGVVSGWNGKFSPDAKISRQEIASMLARYVDKAAGYILPTSIAKVTFSDSSNISDYAEKAVTAMQQAGIINGYSNGSFGPNAEATRAEASKMIASLLQDMMEL